MMLWCGLRGVPVVCLSKQQKQTRGGGGSARARAKSPVVCLDYNFDLFDKPASLMYLIFVTTAAAVFVLAASVAHQTDPNPGSKP